jgi:hypothetical protein
MDVSQDWRRAMWDRTRPFHITGTRITFYVPFEGDAALFQCTPSSQYVGNRPRADVRDSELVFIATAVDPTPDELKTQFERELGMVRDYLRWAAADVAPFNGSLRDKVSSKIETRRIKLLADRGVVESLGFKIRERPNASKTYAVPARRNPSPARPRPKASPPKKLEPALPEQQYEHILGILATMVDVMERSPRAFRTMEGRGLTTALPRAAEQPIRGRGHRRDI